MRNLARIMRCVGVVSALCFAARADDPQLYFGLLHSHTSFSDGQGTPDDAYAMARAAGLDFFAVTEHNHPSAPGVTASDYERLKASAENHSVAGSFAALFGQEFSSLSAGSVLFFNYDEDYRNTLSIVVLSGDFEALGGPDALEAELVGKTVTLKGEITIYNDRPQILLKSRDQILRIQ